VVGAIALTCCSKTEDDPQVAKGATGSIKVDGSSTVAPIAMATAERYRDDHPRVRVTVGISGTGGGFKKFLDESAGLRTDINNASRVIGDVELERAQELGIEFIELPIALDGIAVTVNKGNDFCDYLTVDELNRIWKPGSTIDNWQQIRPDFPDLPLRLYGPGTDSGTFDYFTEVVVGQAKASRSDYTASESDNVLVMGVAGDKGSLGYFGFSYFASNAGQLKLIGIDDGRGKPIKPTLDNIRSGDYQPLSRPLFLYINKESAGRDDVQDFIEFFFEHGKAIIEHPQVNYVSLPDDVQTIAIERFRNKKTGSAMHAAHSTGAGNLIEIFTTH
jgi:phosphate transport system substrate-binding protein